MIRCFYKGFNSFTFNRVFYKIVYSFQMTCWCRINCIAFQNRLKYQRSLFSDILFQTHVLYITWVIKSLNRQKEGTEDFVRPTSFPIDFTVGPSPNDNIYVTLGLYPKTTSGNQEVTSVICLT